jgi:intein-encoded DNA endonuclease-like protein
MKITDEIKDQVLANREQGFSYAKIAKATGISRSSVITIIKDYQIQDLPIQAKVLKVCPNPRIILIYFGDRKENFAKCVVRAGMNYPQGKSLEVKKVDTSVEPLYRLA